MYYHISLNEFVVVLLSFLLFNSCGSSGNNKRGPSGGAASFVDVTEDVGLNFVHEPGVDSSYFMPESIGSGCAFLDYDNDGDLDIYLLNGAYHNPKDMGKPQLRNRLFRQEADGTFIDATEFSGLGDTGYGMGVAVGDIDNDDDADVYISNYGPDALYRNNGDATFTDISKEAGIGNSRWGSSVIFLDYDLDGFLDVYVANYVAYDTSIICTDRAGRVDYCGPTAFAGSPDVLYHNKGDATFLDVSVASKIARGASKGLGVVSADFNDDFYPDLYVANDGEPNHLWINQRDGTFQDKALMLGAAINELGRAEASMGIALGDIDDDGDLDLFMTHLRNESNTFYRNSGEYGFQDNTSPAGLAGLSLPYTGFGTGFFDYDNDGDLDLAIVNGRVTRGPLSTSNKPAGYWDYYAEPNLLLENDGSGNFTDISSTAAFSTDVQNSRGLAFGDVDNDGDIDLLITNEGGRARLFRNDMIGKGHWLIVRAIDPTLQRDAVGSKVIVSVNGKKPHRLIAPGYSFCSSSDPRAHFGLGDTAAVEQIIIQWQDGKTESFPGVEADQIITLKKGQGKLMHE